MSTPSEEEARAAREAMALHLWDEGLVRPESLARAVVDEFIKEGWASRVSTPPSENTFTAMDEAFREHDAPAWDDDAVARDAAIRWHQRGFLDGMKFAPVPATPPSEEWEYECRIITADPGWEWRSCTEDARFCPKGSECRRRLGAGPWEPVPAVPAPPREAPEPEDEQADVEGGLADALDKIARVRELVSEPCTPGCCDHCDGKNEGWEMVLAILDSAVPHRTRGGVMPYRCCKHCVDDPGYHRENPPDSHDTTCSSHYSRCDDTDDQWVPEPEEKR